RASAHHARPQAEERTEFRESVYSAFHPTWLGEPVGNSQSRPASGSSSFPPGFPLLERSICAGGMRTETFLRPTAAVDAWRAHYPPALSGHGLVYAFPTARRLFQGQLQQTPQGSQMYEAHTGSSPHPQEMDLLVDVHSQDAGWFSNGISPH